LRGLLLAWDERYALLTVLIACFGRAISEVGAVMIVGGNIDGFTRVMTTAIALETSKGDLPLALALGVVLLAVVLALNAAMLPLLRALARLAHRQAWRWAKARAHDALLQLKRRTDFGIEWAAGAAWSSTCASRPASAWR
jgi:hypothetical protein